LRVDDEFKTGTLKVVIDQWVTDEEARLKLNTKGNNSLIQWQSSHAFAEDLFRNIVFTLHQSYGNATIVFKEGLSRLDEHFKENNVSAKTRLKVRRSFTDRCLAIFKELQKQVDYDDETWNTFMGWRKLGS
jgi:hypothetical protein